MGGQIYAMPKMKTELHLIADKTGDFRGSSANLSGEGFAGMHFISQSLFRRRLSTMGGISQRIRNNLLTWKNIKNWLLPVKIILLEIYQLKDENLFNQIIDEIYAPTRK